MAYDLTGFLNDNPPAINAANLNKMDNQIYVLDGTLTFDEFLINGGEYTIKASDLESGQWGYSTKVANTKRARSKILFPVHAGTEVTYFNTTFDIFLGVLETPTSQSYIVGQSGWKTNASGTFKVTADGYMTFIIRNHADNNAPVDPSTFNSVVTIKTKYNKDIKNLLADSQYNFNNYVDLLENITYTDGESHNVTYTWDNGVCTANGTSDDYSFNTFLYRDALPSGVSTGDVIPVNVDTEDANLCFRIIFLDSSNNVLTTNIFNTAGSVVVPASATKWNFQIYVAPNKTISNKKIYNLGVFAPTKNKAIKRRLFEEYLPSASTFSVWNDMPNNSYSNVTGDKFKNSISTDLGIIDSWTYQILKIFNRLYISCPATNQLFLGQISTGGTEYWMEQEKAGSGVLSNNTNLDTVKKWGYYVLDSVNTYTNNPLPSGYGGVMLVFPATANSVLQIVFKNATASTMYYRVSYVGTFPSAWTQSESGTVINNYYDSFENTYNIECSPTITTDTNNYLASTGDTTDRTGDIQTMLNTTGVCHLGPGAFYVTGVEVPNNGCLYGEGNKTRLVLASSVTSGYAVKLKTNSAVRTMLIDGNPAGTEITRPSAVGTRHGIYFQGNADAQTSPTTFYRSSISNCMIRNFTGGGITCYNTGLSPASHLVVSDCQIYWCGAGVNVSYYSEFHRFTNVTCQQCLYGCVDNGGNNNFANCDFSSNTQGLLIDNRASQSPNNSHGSFVGCTFNHSDNNTGIAIQILGATAGEIFTAPQIFYGAIDIENAVGIRIVGANIGRAVPITVKNSTVVTFADCNMYSASESGLTQSGNTRLEFKDCYNRDGSVYDPLA